VSTRLQFITSQSLTSSASSFSVTNCFSDIYDVYHIICTDFVQVTPNTYTNFKLIDNGGSVLSANYDSAEYQMASYATFEQVRATSASQMFDRLNFNDSTATGVGLSIMVFNPFSSSSFTYAINNSVGFAQTSGGIAFRGIAVHKSAESITGFNFVMDTGAITSGTVNVFGVK
jgi:hypothetical protein